MDAWSYISVLILGMAFMVALIVIAVVSYVIIASIRDYRLEKKGVKAVEDGIPTFDAFDSGDYLTIAGRKWKVREIETSFDLDYNQDKVLIILSSDRDDLLWGDNK